MNKEFTIIGGGIAGLTTAIALRRIGIRATILEAAPGLQAAGAGLGLATNAIKALHEIGIAEDIMQGGKCFDHFIIYDEKGKKITQANTSAATSRYGTDNFTIHRAVLQELLLSKIDPQSLFTGRRIIGVKQHTSGVTLFLSDGGRHETDYLLVADGIHSRIRQQLVPGSVPRYAGYTCWRAVIDNPGLCLKDTSETWGAGGRFGIVPLTENKIYWFACINAPQAGSAMKDYKTADLLRHFDRYHSPVPEILLHTKDDQLLWNDIYDLRPLPHYAFGRILLLGDAAHATTPNMGQGACQALEDAAVLMNLLKTKDPAAAFVLFEKRRLKRTHYIIRTSARIGKIAQIQNRAACSIRNFVLRGLPRNLHERKLGKLYDIKFA